MTDQEAAQVLLQALGVNNSAGGEAPPLGTAPLQWSPNYAEEFMRSEQGGQPVTDPRILDMLARGEQHIVEDAQGNVMPFSSDPMDGPEQEASTLARLPNVERVGRINENTRNTGIRAVVDDKGHVTLTNLTDDGKEMVKGAEYYDSSGNAVGLPVKNTVQSLLTQMRSTTNPDALRGLQGQFNEALAVEQAKLTQQAQEHATNVLGIPALERQLAYMQSLERMQEGWMPNMPESPATLAIRQRLNQARGLADAEAQRYLAGNVTAHSLSAAAKTAEAEITRASKLADRVADREDRQAFSREQMVLGKKMTQEAREEERQEKLRIEAMSLTEQQKEVARVIFQKPQATDEELLLTIKATKDPATRDVLYADDGALPLLAVTGNTKALSIIEAKEAAVGVDPLTTKARVQELRRIMSDPRLLQEGVNERMKGASKDEQRAAMAAITSKEVLGTPEEKKAAMYSKFEMAKAKLQQGISTHFRNDLNSWGISDPEFVAATTRAKETVGSANLRDVLVEYLGNTTGQERQQRLEQFKSYASTAAKRTAGSSLGSIDPVMLTNDINTVYVQSRFYQLQQQMSVGNRLKNIYQGVVR